jgi:Dolichyl-phosphate-mannose-protein mannosyltransferase
MMLKRLRRRVSDFWTRLLRADLSAALDGVRSHIQRRKWRWSVVLVVAVWIVGVALTMQGWRSRIPAFDLLTYINSAHDLVSTGSIPEHGDNGSYGSFKPAGTAWLMVPSTILFGDPRLSEYVGTAFLHLATLVGLFLLARKYFGEWCACLAVVLYGLSEIALFLAGSLWPNGRPDFYVWTVYLASEWVTRRDPRFLAAALAVWGIGMQVDMALAPAFFVLPALWLAYRPSVRLRPLLLAAALVFVVWAPYLRFEAPRRFADIRSQLQLRYIVPSDVKKAWCDPTLSLHRFQDRASASVDGAPTEAVAEARTSVSNAVEDRLLSNFDSVSPIPGTGVALLLLVLGALVLTNVTGGTAAMRRPKNGDRWWRRRLTPLSVGAILVGLPVYAIARLGDGQLALSTQRAGKFLVVGGTVLLATRLAAAAANQVLARYAITLQTAAQVTERRAVVLSLAVPWTILVVISEPDKPERFWWLWPLQVLFLAALVSVFLPRIGAPSPAVWVAQASLVLLVLGNSFLDSRVDAWRSEGWSGRDAPQVKVVDYVADRIRSDGRDRAPIGYRIFIYPFMANYHILNPEYKVGAEFDVLFRYRRDITNTNGCAEGFSPHDQYRIVRTAPGERASAPNEYFDVPLGDGFRLVREFGPYQVFERA